MEEIEEIEYSTKNKHKIIDETERYRRPPWIIFNTDKPRQKWDLLVMIAACFCCF